MSQATLPWAPHLLPSGVDGPLSEMPGFNADSTLSWLCGLGEVTSPPRATISLCIQRWYYSTWEGSPPARWDDRGAFKKVLTPGQAGVAQLVGHRPLH